MEPARLATIALLLSAACAACGSTEDRSQPGGATGEADAGVAPPDAEGEPSPIVWESCPLYSDGSGFAVECSRVEVPLRWADPDADRLELFVKRVRTGPGQARQLWFLNGGPGGPGADYEPLVEALVPYLPDADMYLLDHRGTGRSSRLGCPAEADDSEAGLTITDAEWPACIEALQAEWGDRLTGFTTTNAAQDLGWLIERTRGPDQEVHVHGGSYGTYWAQRLLQVRPGAADAVSLLGIAPPTISITEYDYWFNEVGKDYLEACAADALCASKLGPDPLARTAQIFAKLDEGHCPEAQVLGFDRGGLRRLFATLIFFSWEERVLVPATLYRLERCDPADVEALATFAEAVSAPVEPDVYDRLEAPVLGRHIGLSELWAEPPPSPEELAAVVDEAWFSTEAGLRFAPAYPLWPRYAPDRLDGSWAETEVPMLMMNGSLDPATPLALASTAGEHFHGPGQRFVTLPGGAHSWDVPTTSGAWCPLLLFLDFALDPGQPVDDACLADVLPLDFAGDDSLAWGAFGRGDIWENEVADSRRQGPGRSGREQLQRVLRRARRSLR